MKRNTLESVSAEIRSFFMRNRRMPTYQEMMEILGVRSKSVVHHWVSKLIAQGKLKRDERGHLIPSGSLFAIPVFGAIHAGFPSPEDEALRDIISLDEYLINQPETSFLLQVTGDSMIDAGIMEGDLVIVERGRIPKSGDIVVAEVDGEWTVKYFRKKGQNVYLEAANPHYPPIKPKNELRLAGVVTALVRKYHI
ncbi:MAG: transcriptional repressor LexA [Syntrophales bacterium]|nr:transcriptional repressor LexA [Syntrophales bacterium]